MLVGLFFWWWTALSLTYLNGLGLNYVDGKVNTPYLQMTLSVVRVCGMANCLQQYLSIICLQRAPPHDTIQEHSTDVPFTPRTMKTWRLVALQFHAVRLLPTNIRKYNFAFCFRRVWLLVCHTEEGTQAEGVWEYGAEGVN
jgi:hypothetical protein